MKHSVKVYNIDKDRCIFERHYETAEVAQKEYDEYLKITKALAKKGEHLKIARFNDDCIMEQETIEVK